MRSTVLLFPLLLLVTGGGSELDPVDPAVLRSAEGWMGLVPPSDTDGSAFRAARSGAVRDSTRVVLRTDRPACPMPVVRPPKGLLILVPPSLTPPGKRLPLALHDSSGAGLARMPVAPSGCVNPLFDTTSVAARHRR